MGPHGPWTPWGVWTPALGPFRLMESLGGLGGGIPMAHFWAYGVPMAPFWAYGASGLMVGSVVEKSDLG